MAGQSQRYRIEETDIAVGARIRVRRRELNLTQESLAEALGVTYQQVQKYERGADRVSVSMLIKIAKRLGCSVASLVGEEPGAVEDTIAPRLAVPGALELLDIYSRIDSSSTRRRLLELMNDLAKTATSSEVKGSLPIPWRRGIKKTAPDAKPRRSPRRKTLDRS